MHSMYETKKRPEIIKHNITEQNMKNLNHMRMKTYTHMLIDVEAHNHNHSFDLDFKVVTKASIYKFAKSKSRDMCLDSVSFF